MPKIHVAYRTDAGGAGMRCASGSFTTLKKRLSQAPSSQWTVAHYNLKADVPTICGLIENITAVQYEGELESFRVTETGQVRKETGSAAA